MVDSDMSRQCSTRGYCSPDPEAGPGCHVLLLQLWARDTWAVLWRVLDQATSHRKTLTCSRIGQLEQKTYIQKLYQKGFLFVFQQPVLQML